jgi:very-short-patch-repair endonuclease
MSEATDECITLEGFNECEYSALLTELGFEHERQVCPWKEAGRMFAIDFACPVRKIAVEYDGGFHYLSSGRENGKTIAKRRLLERAGWKVVSIPYQVDMRMNSREFQEKHKAKGDKRELKKLFLKKLLREKAGLKL